MHPAHARLGRRLCFPWLSSPRLTFAMFIEAFHTTVSTQAEMKVTTICSLLSATEVQCGEKAA